MSDNSNNKEFVPTDEKPLYKKMLVLNLIHSEIDRANAEYFMAQFQDDTDASRIANNKIFVLLTVESWFKELTSGY